MGTVIRVYEKVLKRYPLLTSSIQTAMLMGTGDIISQTVIEETPLTKVNLKRTTQFASVGLFLVVRIYLITHLYTIYKRALFIIN